MKCPKCQGQFKEEMFHGILINRCDTCGCIWLDEPELNELEDTVWSDDDDAKGTLEADTRVSDLSCPVCSKTMVRFNYRFFDLELDTCPDMHGFWLDKGEEKRILELMKKERSDDKRSMKAEEEWATSLGRINTKGFFQKVKDTLHL